MLHICLNFLWKIQKYQRADISVITTKKFIWVYNVDKANCIKCTHNISQWIKRNEVMKTYNQARIPKEDYYENQIELDKIHYLDTAKFFDNLDTSCKIELNELLIKICKEVVNESYDKGGKEAGAIINTVSKKYAICEAKYFGKIKFTEHDNYNKISNESNENSCIVIHNHNNSFFFSAQDIETFLNDDKVHTIAVITSNMNIFILCKENKDYSAVLDYMCNDLLFNSVTPDLMEVLRDNGLVIRRITS